MSLKIEITCENCGKSAIKSSKKAKYCSKVCNQRAYEKRKGIKKPSFIGNTPKNQVAKKTYGLPYQIQDQINNIVQPQLTEKQKLSRRKQILLNEFSRIVNKSNFKSNEGKMFGGIIGMIVGMKNLKKDDSFFEVGAKLLGIPYLFSLVGKNILTSKATKHTTTELKRLDSIGIEIAAIDQRLNQIELTGIEVAKIKSEFQGNPQPTKPIYKGSEYQYQKLKTLPFSDMWLYLIGKPSPNFFMLVTGSPGNGKTTAAVKFAKYFHKNHGKTLYIPSEQGGFNVAFQSLLKKFDTDFDIFVDTKSLNSKNIVEKIKGYDLVILDSLNHMKIEHEEMEEIRRKLPNTAFVGILQSTKDGKYKGSQELEHNCDIFIKMKNMIAYQTKSRFAAPAHHMIE